MKEESLQAANQAFVIEEACIREMQAYFDEEVFSKLKNEVGMKELNGKIVVYQVADISYDKKKEEENWQRSFVSLLLNYSDDMYQQLIGHLSKKYEVKINYDILKEIDESIDPSSLDEVF